ncbi:MAG TPA: cytochrome D1 domain-containing protein [Azospirillaceae bacterium]|nr:cytochrome D1 domain-containing protein [Azospirillaceae bacterium]
MRRFAFLLPMLLAATAWAGEPRGTGDLGIVVERAAGRVQVVDTTGRARLATVPDLGDLSHASAVFSRDGRFAYVFGRDGGLTKVDLLEARVVRRIVQAGNSIGGAISQDGRLVAVSNYEPGGVRVFDAGTLDPVADIPTPGSKVVGLVDAPGQRFVFSLFEAGDIWLADLTDPKRPAVTRWTGVGRQPYDALITPDGRFYLAGLFGEDGMALVDLWYPEQGVRRILAGYGRGEAPLPVYKMPHLEGWAFAGRRAFVPAVGRHEILVMDRDTWTEVGRVPVQGQPVFAVGRPDGRQVWVNFAPPDNGTVQVIDTETMAVVKTLAPGPGVLHLEFTPKGEAVWLSVRDADRVDVLDTRTFEPLARLPADKPSGLFFTARAHRIGQ